MKRSIIGVTFCILLTACDYFCNNDFVVINNTPDDIVIETIISSYDNGINFNDSIYTIKPGKKITFSQDLGLCGKDSYPPDFYKSNDTIPQATKFDIYISDNLYDTLRLRKFWSHSVSEQIGTYTLTITQELIDGF